MKVPTATRNAAVDSLTALIDAGSGPGYIEVRSGGGPATPNDAANGSLLATIPLPDPCFAASSSGTATANPIDVVSGSGNGNAGWFRVYDSDDNSVEDGTVSVSGGGAELELNTVVISTGVDVAVTGWTITLPES